MEYALLLVEELGTSMAEYLHAISCPLLGISSLSLE